MTRDVAGIFCREELYGGQAWQELRNLARDVLDEVDLESHPVPTPIRFDELIEIVGPLPRRKKHEPQDATSRDAAGRMIG